MYWSCAQETSSLKKSAKTTSLLCFFSYLIYSGLASNYCALCSTIPLGMFRSASTYKVGKVNTFLGEFKVLLYSWGWHHTCLQGMCQGTCREMPALIQCRYAYELYVIAECDNLICCQELSEIAVHCTNSHVLSFV